MLNRPEILAPAGTSDAARAAVNAGADAIYVGGSMFSARAFAGNPDTNELLNIIDYCHINNVKLYMAVNTLLKNNEIDILADYMLPYVKQGLDGVIIQDIGVFNVLKAAFPELTLHGSTQMSITSSYGADFLKKHGFSRFVPARELSLNEIKSIKEKTDIEIEVFVHGAMCYCYSGKCLMSSFAGGRSGNRGRCAQPCRKRYSGKEFDGYTLSLKDMCMLHDVGILAESGVDSFKIEGRMKKPEYVAATVYAYKEVCNAYFSGEDYIKIADKYNNMLLDVYNRGGFSKGYYFVRNSRNMLADKRPNHQGIAVGTVTSIEKPYIVVKTCEAVNKGDVLEIRTKNGDVEITSGVSGLKNKSLLLKAKDFSRISQGDAVYRTRNNMLLDEINNKIVSNIKKTHIDVNITAKQGERLCLELTNPYSNKKISVQSDYVSAAENKPVSREQIFDKLKRTGGTEFEFNLTGDIDDDIFVQLGKINALRREGIEKLRFDMAEFFHRDISYDTHDCTKGDCEKVKKCCLCGTVCHVRTKEQFRIVNNYEFVQSIILEYNAYRDVIDDIKISTADIYIALPDVMRENSINHLKEIYKNTKNCRGYLVKNIDELYFLHENGYQGRVLFDSWLYAYNDEAVKFLSEMFDEYAFIASDELRLEEISSINYSPVIKIYGHQQVMYTANCMYSYYFGGDRHKNDMCIKLNDEKGNVFYAVNNCDICGTAIYNGLPTDISDYYFSNKNDIACCLLDFTIEDGRQTEVVMNSFAAHDDDGDRISSSVNKNYTRGHYFRGID